MVQQLVTQEDRYLVAFDAFQRNGALQDQAWVQQLRQAALHRFRELGFPVARRGNEEWKYTDIAPIARTPFQPVSDVAPLALATQEMERLTFGNSHWSRIVFVDGRYSKHLSSFAELPVGTRVMSLAEAMAAEGDLVRQHLGQYAPYQDNAFTALNTAFAHDGALVHVADGAMAPDPIHLLFISTGRQQDLVTHPRILIIAGKDSHASIIESYACLAEARSFTNAVTEVVVGSGAALKYYKVQRQSQQAFHITNTHVLNAQNASFSSVNLDLGGGLVRNNLNLLTGGDGGSCMLNGLYVLEGTQHVDNQVVIDHAHSYTTASELYKGILNHGAHSVFHGSIIVREGLRKINANQVDKNLLLSDQCEADTKPAFWIYSDDVRCGHGAACGQIDQNALFYLRSRGMDEIAARRTITRAFATEVMDTVALEALRTSVDGLVQDKLSQWWEDGAGR